VSERRVKASDSESRVRRVGSESGRYGVESAVGGSEPSTLDVSRSSESRGSRGKRRSERRGH
jgi:hypothetical protein